MPVDSTNLVEFLEDMLSAIATPQFLVIAFVCLIYGMIPFAYVFPLLLRRRRVNVEGTGNVGIANAFGVGGLPAGFLAVAGEASKAALPMVLARVFLDGSLPLVLILVFLSLLATNFSPLAGGRAGQGGTVVLWTLLLISPAVFLAFLAGFVVIFLITRNRYLTNLLGHVALPFEMYLLGSHWSFILFGALAAVLSSVRYDRRRSDYSYYRGSMRLLNWFERRFGARETYLCRVDEASDVSRAGSKSAGLAYLHRHGFRIPRTWVCGFDAFDAFAAGNDGVISTLESELERALPKDIEYCVRSSADVEDAASHSFAGQFETQLDLKSVSEILQAIQFIWNSSAAARVQAYSARVGLRARPVRMACVIQEMVRADMSGVVFTRNPLNGLDEVVVEAVTGLGDALLQSGVTPDRWVYKWGAWKEKPVGKDDQLEIVQRLVTEARWIARKRGRPLDLEWSFDGRDLYWLQMREITSLNGLNIYSNRIAKEFLPGLIKPLVWSINIPTVNTSWKRLLVEAVGNDARGIDVSNLAKSFHYHAYFNMGVLGDIFELLGMPRESLELVLGIEVPSGERPKMRPSFRSLKYLPRLCLFLLRMVTISGTIERMVVARRSGLSELAGSDVHLLDRDNAVRSVEALQRTCVEISYYLIVSQVLTGVYNHLLSRSLTRAGASAQQLSFSGTRRALKNVDPAQHLSDLQREYAMLPDSTKQSLVHGGASALATLPEARVFSTRFWEFLVKFGHLSDSGNDFSRPAWRETPDLVLRMISSLRDVTPPSHDETPGSISGKSPRALWGRFVYRRAAQFRVYREEVSALYAFGYSLFRSHFLHIGHLLRQTGHLEAPDEVFYLTWDEAKCALEGKTPVELARDLVADRKQEMKACEPIQMPEVIIGDSLPPRSVSDHVEGSLQGVAASRGHFTGPARVVRGLEDSSKVEQGDILIIPYSDVSWTLLISRAGAVVSESGGLLSHCAIVAREYGIPAVVSVAGAMLLADGVCVAVDGNRGQVAILGDRT